MKHVAGFVIAIVVAGACSKSGESTPPASNAAPAAGGSAGALPAPGRFVVEAAHSTVLFKVRHVDAGYIYGWFKDYTGTFTIDADPKRSHIELAVKADSVDTRDAERDGNITGPDFLNAKQFPTLEFKSTSVDADGAGWRVTGDLTIRGITKPVTFTATPVGEAKNPQGWKPGTRFVGVEATFTITRGDFGVTFMPEIVGPKIELIIALEGTAA